MALEGSKPRRRRAVAPKHKELLDAHRHRYEAILETQEGHCALCPRVPSPRRKLDLDHDHTRMVIRGLLCHRCNRTLKSWITPEWLLKAATYIQGEA